jgi:hypothetical protein
VPDAFQHAAFQYAIDKMIGNGNKLVFLDANGEAYIAREHAGEWEHGIWYSNSGYKPWRGSSCEDSTTRLFLPAEYYEQMRRNNVVSAPIDWTPRNETERLLGAPSQLGTREIHATTPAELDALDNAIIEQAIETSGESRESALGM